MSDRKVAPKAGDRIRITGGAWQSAVGKRGRVVVTDAQVTTVVIDGEPGSLSLSTKHVRVLSG